ncbi:MAG: 30S ribosomal protein S6 [Actinomycetes bacterium]|nr:30S ribosomal protein S6 [Actinomycetes bacterium]
MKAYELLVIFNPTLSEDDRAAALERATKLVGDGGSVIDEVNEWGKQKLAYEINKIKDGDYVLFDFHANPEHVAEIDRVLRITDTVVRFMMVRREDKD